MCSVLRSRLEKYKANSKVSEVSHWKQFDISFLFLNGLELLCIYTVNIGW